MNSSTGHGKMKASEEEESTNCLPFQATDVTTPEPTNQTLHLKCFSPECTISCMAK